VAEYNLEVQGKTGVVQPVPRREEIEALNIPLYKYCVIFRLNGVCDSQNHYPAFAGSGSLLEMYDETLEEMNT
jgi:hypothetical protein